MLKSPLSLDRKITHERVITIIGNTPFKSNIEYYGFTLKEYLEYFKDVLKEVNQIFPDYITKTAKVSKYELRELINYINTILFNKYLLNHKLLYTPDNYFVTSGVILQVPIEIREPENLENFKDDFIEKFLSNLRIVIKLPKKTSEINNQGIILPLEYLFITSENISLLEKYAFINILKMPSGILLPNGVSLKTNLNTFLSTLPQYTSFIDFIKSNVFYNDMLGDIYYFREEISEEANKIYRNYLEKHFENLISGSLINGEEFNIRYKPVSSVVIPQASTKKPRRRPKLSQLEEALNEVNLE